MRTTTADQDVVLAKASRSVHLRVFVDRGSSDWVNMSDLEGRDWVQGVEYSGSNDSTSLTATVQLHGRMESLSLSPLMFGSKLNSSGVILELGHPIYIETATMPDGTPPGASDWVEVFRGEIDEIQWDTSPIQLRCRDQSGVLDRFIETQVQRPFTLNVDRVENIMQEIIDGELGEGVVALYSITGDAVTPFKTADSPDWLLPAYIQKKQPIIQALRVLADQIGWYVRYLWNDSTGAFELTFYEPGRELAAQGSLLMTGQPTNRQTFVLNSTPVTAVTGGAVGDEFNIGTSVSETASNIAAALNDGSESGNISKAWTTGATFASGTLTFTGQPVATETMTINATPITAVADAPGPNDFQIGGSLIATLDNLVTTLRTTCDEKENIVATRIGSTVKISWGVAGSVGAAIVFLSALSNCGVDGGGTLGGTDPGLDAKVTVEWGTKGTAGNAIVWIEALANCTADGGGTLGGTVLGQDLPVSHTFIPDRYYTVGSLKMSRAGIRNVIRVKYGVGQLDRTTIEVVDTDSIDKYRRRWMEVAEDASSQIDTETEATRMANAILADLSEPDADQSVEMPYFWPVETGDFDRFAANDYHYDSGQDLAVLSFRHQLSTDRSRTTVTCRGKPSGGFKRWLAIEARPGVAPQNSFYEHNAAEGSVITQGVGLVVVVYDDPRGMKPPISDWAFTKCHISTSSGFTPSFSNLAAVGKQTRFELGGLVPGATYYVKLVIVDSAGTETLPSTQVFTATEKVGAYHENSDTVRGNITPNGTFGQSTLDINTHPPDGWSIVDGVWGTDIYADEQTTATGGRAIAMGPDGAVDDSGLISDFIPITDLDPYAIFIFARVDFRTAAQNRVKLRLTGYDGDKVEIASGGLLSFAPSETSWSRFGTTYIVQTLFAGITPVLAAARYMRVSFEREDNFANGFTLYVDRIMVTKQLSRFKAHRSAAQSINSGAPTPVGFDSEIYDEGDWLTAARGALTLTGLPSALDTFVVNATTCTAVSGAPAADQFQIGGDAETTAQNIVDMLNADSESANITAWRSAAVVFVAWGIPGASGNAIVWTSALTNATADGGGTLGGTLVGGIRYGHDSTTIKGRFTCLQEGDYYFSACVGLGSGVNLMADGDTVSCEFRVNGVSAGGGQILVMGGDGFVRLVATTSQSLVRGDYVEVWVEHDHGSARAITLGRENTFFLGFRAPGEE